MKKVLLILVFLLAINFAAASSVTIKSVSTTPVDVNPGQTLDVSILLDNQGQDTIENIQVALDLTNVPFIPIGSAAEKVIDEIEEDDTSRVSFALRSLQDAKPGLYKIPLKVKYQDGEQQTIMGVSIVATPELDVAIEDTDLYTIGQTGTITVRIVNKGLTEVKFLSVRLDNSIYYDILSANSYYVGNIEPDDFETVEFKIYLKEATYSLPMNIEYKDLNNNLIQENKWLPINIYSKEEALKIGLIKESNFSLIIIVIIIVIILLLVYRSYRKRKRLREALQ